MDREILIAAASLYFPLIFAAILVWLTRPKKPEWTGILLATCWQLAFLLPVNLLAQRLGWWSFGEGEFVLLGMRVELWLGWVVLWGVAAPLVPRLPISLKLLVFLVFDLVAMPACAPLVALGASWLIGEALLIGGCLLPGLLLADWTRSRSRLWGRVWLQGLAFAGLMFVLLPIVIIEHAGVGGLEVIGARARWENMLFVSAIVLLAAPGVTAVGEFAGRGRGTALPLDPPERLVTSGIYGYLSNPMQTSTALALATYGWWLGSGWFVGAGVMTVVFSAGLAAWAERGELEARFGDRWKAYRRGVRVWLPRWRPYVPEGETAKVYIAKSCEPCRGVRKLLEAMSSRGLEICDAESFEGEPLRRGTYVGADGYRTDGIGALARSLEHCHFGWATVAAVLRLPGLRQILQVVVDASGGGPRDLDRS